VPEEGREGPDGGDAAPALELGLGGGRFGVDGEGGRGMGDGRAAPNVYDGRIVNFEGQMFLAEIGPVKVLRFDQRDDNGVGYWTESTRNGAPHARNSGSCRSNCNSAVKRICSTEPDCNTGCHTEERRYDSCGSRLTTPQYGKGCGEDAGAGEYTKHVECPA